MASTNNEMSETKLKTDLVLGHLLSTRTLFSPKISTVWLVWPHLLETPHLFAPLSLFPLQHTRCTTLPRVKHFSRSGKCMARARLCTARKKIQQVFKKKKKKKSKTFQNQQCQEWK